jgi:hypothetical protein
MSLEHDAPMRGGQVPVTLAVTNRAPHGPTLLSPCAQAPRDRSALAIYWAQFRALLTRNALLKARAAPGRQ